ncbi:MAG: TIGR01212 family radical SAM protein [Deltaproteobacteria bacterium]|nr:MAG: TIGR01212 family radical SAM protein [Deltaproteobacteria bacterium]UCH06390.1 MAG: TIGR01212 family radical SAM protein [Deltaproteobacteria bacterium]
MKKPYYDLNTYLRSIFGCRVQKISLDAGLTCPNRDGRIGTGGCIYCNTRGSGTGACALGLTITEQIERGKEFLRKRYKAQRFIAYFQSFSNTYAPYEKLKALYDEACAVEDIVGLSIGTRPDCIDESILTLVQGYAEDYLVWIEYGLQSIHDRTLVVINRGHDVACFRSAVEKTKGRGIKICAHVILGLPFEDRRDMLATAQAVSSMGIDGIKIHLLYVVKGTPMERLYREGTYRCLEQGEYAELVCDFLELLPPDMVIQRLTGDPHPDELAAPEWSLRKSETLSLIKKTMAGRGSWQGKRFGENPFP